MTCVYIESRKWLIPFMLFGVYAGIIVGFLSAPIHFKVTWPSIQTIISRFGDSLFTFGRAACDLWLHLVARTFVAIHQAYDQLRETGDYEEGHHETWQPTWDQRNKMIGLGNKRIQGGVCLQCLDLCLHAVCKLQRIWLKRMYSTSSLFQAMELWNLSEGCLAMSDQTSCRSFRSRIVNTSRGGLIDTRALIHGHFVRKKNDIAWSLTLLLCHSPVILVLNSEKIQEWLFRWWDHAPFTWELRFKDWSHCWCCNGCCGKRSTILLQDRIWGLWFLGFHVHWIFEQWDQFNQFNSSSLRA